MREYTLRDMTINISSSLSLVDCVFCFQIMIKTSLTRHTNVVLMFLMPIYFLVDAASGNYGEICPGFTQK